MITRGRLVLLPVLALSAGLAGCGSGSTVEGTVSPSPEAAAPTSAQSPTSVPAEQPVPVTSAVTPPTPPAPPSSAPAPAPVPPSAPAPAPPGAGDFVGLLAVRGAVPQGKDAVDLAHQACAQFDQGRTMMDVSDWLSQQTGFTPDQQGFFLGAGVATYCPQNTGKLG